MGSRRRRSRPDLAGARQPLAERNGSDGRFAASRARGDQRPIAGGMVEIAVSDTGQGLSEAVRAKLFRTIFHHQGGRDGRAVDQPNHYRGAWRQAFGRIQRRRRRDVSPLPAGGGVMGAVTTLELVVLRRRRRRGDARFARLSAAPPASRSRLSNWRRSCSTRCPKVRGGCLVSDVRMPGMDGIELLRRLKATHPGLPVVPDHLTWRRAACGRGDEARRRRFRRKAVRRRAADRRHSRRPVRRARATRTPTASSRRASPR